MNGAWMNEASGQPVGVRRDREDRVGRERAADLGEDPDEVDVEALAGGERARDIDVVVRVGVRRVREQDASRPPGRRRRARYRSRGIRTAGAA